MKKYFSLFSMLAIINFPSCEKKCQCGPGPDLLLTIEYLNKDQTNLFSNETVSATEDIKVYYLFGGSSFYKTGLNGKGYVFFENRNHKTIISLNQNEFIHDYTSTTLVKIKEFTPDTIVTIYNEENQIKEFLINGLVKYSPGEKMPLVLIK